MQINSLLNPKLLKIVETNMSDGKRVSPAWQNVLTEISTLLESDNGNSGKMNSNKTNGHSQNSPAGVCQIDESYHIIYANSAFYKIIEDSPEVPGASQIENLFHSKEDCAVFFRELKDNKGVHIATSWLTIGGYIKNVELIASSFNGVIQVTVIDVTNREIAEIEKNAEFDRYKMFLEVMHEGMSFTNQEGQITFVNSRFCTLIGLPKDQVIGRMLSDIIPESILALDREEFPKDNSDINEASRIGVVIKVRNQKRWLYISRKETYNLEGEYIGSVDVFTDVTQMESSRQRISEYNVKLEKEVSDRRAIEFSLLQKTSDLEQMVSELEDFAYVTAHDLQEPLRSISSYVQLLERRYADQLDDCAIEYIAFAVEGAKRMKHMLQDLLAYISLNTDAVLPSEYTDLNEVVEIAMDNLSDKIRESNTVIELDTLPQLAVEPSDLILFFEQLIDNSIKFKKETKNRIRISAIQTPKGWTISFKDNGIGFDQTYSAKIFQLFQRLHNRELYEGTGIGLALCKKIAQRHRGSVSVQSKEGEGSTFYLDLPI